MELLKPSLTGDLPFCHLLPTKPAGALKFWVSARNIFFVWDVPWPTRGSWYVKRECHQLVGIKLSAWLDSWGVVHGCPLAEDMTSVSWVTTVSVPKVDLEILHWNNIWTRHQVLDISLRMGLLCLPLPMWKVADVFIGPRRTYVQWLLWHLFTSVQSPCRVSQPSSIKFSEDCFLHNWNWYLPPSGIHYIELCLWIG